MAAGEYVSVHSQADTEKADLRREQAELKADDSGEHAELAAPSFWLRWRQARPCPHHGSTRIPFPVEPIGTFRA
jgi:hypothetical protein